MSYKKVFLIFGIILFILICIVAILYSQKTNIPDPKDPTQEKEGFFSFFPFGGSSPQTSTSTNGTNNNNGNGFINNGPDNGSIAKLRQISTVPTAGAVSFERKSTTTSDFFNPTTTLKTGTSTTPTVTVIRFIERATGHIYETFSTSYTLKRVSNQTMPKLYEAYFDPIGNNFVAQTITSATDVIDTFVALNTATNQNQDEKYTQYPLQDGLLYFIMSPLKTRFFYLTENENGNGSVGYISSGFNDEVTEAKKIVSSPLTQWSVDWPTEDTIVLTTKANSLFNGLAQAINTKTGGITTLLSDIPALTTLTNRNISMLLYSTIEREKPAFYHYNIKTEEKSILSFQTLPEKCVWSKKNLSVAYCAAPITLPAGNYPEDWYQGNVSFTDALWKLDFSTFSYEIMLEPEDERNISLDMINLFMSEKEDFIYFTNKKDLTLWSYDLLR